MSLPRSLRWVPLLALAAAVACGDDDDDVTSPTGSIAVAIDPAALTVTQGQTGTIAVTIARAGSFNDDVDLTVEGAPTGVTFDFDPASVAAGATTSTLTLTVAADAPTATTTLTIRAEGTGVTDATKTVDLTVVAPTSSSRSPAIGTSTMLALAH